MIITTPASPVKQPDRIAVLDSLRGIAVLGILLVNILIFALPDVVAENPATLEESGINYYLWYGVSWLFEGTQRALFSILFGAGIVLFSGRYENKSIGPSTYFFRRQLWLIAFAVFDVYVLLWSGDILLVYACFGMLLFVFRNLSPKKLFILSGICLALMLARENVNFYETKTELLESAAIMEIDTTQTRLTPEQSLKFEEFAAAMIENTQAGRISTMIEENQLYQSDFSTVYEARTNDYHSELVYDLYEQLWDVIVCMLLGMALLKTGVLTGQASVRTYSWMGIIGLGAGLTLSYFRLQPLLDAYFNWLIYYKNVTFQYYSADRLLRTFGILGAFMLMVKSGAFKWFLELVRPVGQMALTNYLMQSLICCILFNGFAFGLYGKLQRYELYLIVIAIWIFQIIFCQLWMRYYLFGPLEWVWRSLTYWKKQEFVRCDVCRSDSGQI